MNLIIVESPTKAKTFNSFLKGKKFQVEASLGHVRDLPENKIAVDIAANYTPNYVISPKKKSVVSNLKKLAKKAESIILATDSDREGEAISYHIAYLLGFIKEDWPKSELKKVNSIKRIVFHEITQSAFEEALKKPQAINFHLVDAQQARRILDRLVGYTLSPLLWKKIGKGWLSAGRVQTVALRFIVEREREIEEFKTEPYFKVSGLFSEERDLVNQVLAKLIAKRDTKYEQKFKLKLFDGEYTYSKTTIHEENRHDLEKNIQSDSYKVDDIVETISKRYPSPPFTTSTLQQEASRKFGYAAKFTMRLAQELYERGFISYHRTDSLSLSQKFLDETKIFIDQTFGTKYVIASPRQYKTKSKLAQEAHEAIRPTQMRQDLDTTEVPLSSAHLKLYNLIFSRAIASQMKEAEIKTIKIKILGTMSYLFESGFESVMFDGFMKAYPQKEEKVLPNISLKKDMSVHLNKLEFTGDNTQPPPRYNEASLIKTLEEAGIGRPSTYAPTISTIQDRNYVEKTEGRFYPTFLGKTVCNYLSHAFADFFAINFTATMEEDLDLIAEGKKDLVSVLDYYYKPFSKKLETEKANHQHINVQEKTTEICPQCGKFLVYRYSKYGKFYACSGYPACKFTKPFFEKIALKCPKCQGDIIVKYTRKKRRFYGCSNYPTCDFAAWKLNQIPKEAIPPQANQ